MADTATRFTLRQLPLPAKLVISTFLIAVGVGYFSALVQLHMQHSGRNGEALPTPDDVIEKFSGLRKYDSKEQTSKIEALISGEKAGAFDKNNMTPAFFIKSSGYDKECNERGKAVVDAERETERLALISWCNLDASARKTAYDTDKFTLPAKLTGQPITEEFFDQESKTVAIKTLFDARCGRCHNAEKKPVMDEYVKIEPFATAPSLEVIDGKWVRSSKQTTVEGLTQSTHAHLLSFAMLFALTGLTFAFTSYPALVRGIIGPIVLIAQLADISCWWLARLDTVGPMFALAIIGTGTIVGAGLSAQILLSLFNMYGEKGKMVLVVLFFIAAGGFGVLVTQVIEPTLKAEKLKSG